MKSGFFQPRLLSKVKPFFILTERVIHVFITTCIDFCNALYVGVKMLLLVSLPKPFSCLPPLAPCSVVFKVLLFVFKVLHGLAPSHLADLFKPCTSSRSLRSEFQFHLVVSKTRLINICDFSATAPKLENGLYLTVRLDPTSFQNPTWNPPLLLAF